MQLIQVDGSMSKRQQQLGKKGAVRLALGQLSVWPRPSSEEVVYLVEHDLYRWRTRCGCCGMHHHAFDVGGGCGDDALGEALGFGNADLHLLRLAPAGHKDDGDDSPQCRWRLRFSSAFMSSRKRAPVHACSRQGFVVMITMRLPAALARRAMSSGSLVSTSSPSEVISTIDASMLPW